MDKYDFCLLCDPGSSGSKFLLYREPSSVAAHFVPASCSLISSEDYAYEARLSSQKWGTGVVRVPSEDGVRHYRIGLDPVNRTADSIKKWEGVVCKLLCALGWLSQSSKGSLKGSIKILLPLDEYAYRVPMLKVLAYALKNGAEANGYKVANIEIGSIGCEPEGSGLIDGDHRIAAGLMSGHCDLTFILGINGAVDLSRSFTVSGAGAILPLRLSGLPVFQDEVEAAIAFNRQNWSAFAHDGLNLAAVKAMAESGLDEYARSQFKHIQEISNICRDAKISTVQMGGGSVNLNRKVLSATGLKLQGSKAIEQRIEKLLGIRDRSMPSRLVDPFLVWSRNPQVSRYLQHCIDGTTVFHQPNESSFEVLMEHVNA
jgi:hypothetical protein